MFNSNIFIQVSIAKKLYCKKVKNYLFNPFPHDKLFDQTKLKALADDKLNATKMIDSVFDRVENIVGNGEIACTSNFSFSHNVFKRLLSQTCQKVSLCGNGLSHKEQNKPRKDWGSTETHKEV